MITIVKNLNQWMMSPPLCPCFAESDIQSHIQQHATFRCGETQISLPWKTTKQLRDFPKEPQ